MANRARTVQFVVLSTALCGAAHAVESPLETLSVSFQTDVRHPASDSKVSILGSWSYAVPSAQEYIDLSCSGSVILGCAGRNVASWDGSRGWLIRVDEEELAIVPQPPAIFNIMGVPKRALFLFGKLGLEGVESNPSYVVDTISATICRIWRVGSRSPAEVFEVASDAQGRVTTIDDYFRFDAQMESRKALFDRANAGPDDVEPTEMFGGHYRRVYSYSLSEYRQCSGQWIPMLIQQRTPSAVPAASWDIRIDCRTVVVNAPWDSLKQDIAQLFRLFPEYAKTGIQCVDHLRGEQRTVVPSAGPTHDATIVERDVVRALAQAELITKGPESAGSTFSTDKCGSLALFAVHRILGESVPLRDFDGLLSSDDQYVPMRYLAEASTLYGVSPDGRLLSSDDLVKQDPPLIFFGSKGGEGHFYVYCGIEEGGRCLILDGAEVRRVNRKQLESLAVWPTAALIYNVDATETYGFARAIVGVVLIALGTTVVLLRRHLRTKQREWRTGES